MDTLDPRSSGSEGSRFDVLIVQVCRIRGECLPLARLERILSCYDIVSSKATALIRRKEALRLHVTVGTRRGGVL
jgi:hypothetical protein